jgi:hypothetical protein
MPMFRFAVFLFAAAAVLVGCESFSDATSNVRERLAAREEGRTRNFAASQRATYVAVRAAAEQMGYRYLRGGPAQGFFEAVSGIGQGDANRSSRQIAMKVGLKPGVDEGTEVNVRLTEILETESANRAALATEAPLQGTPQYEVFFRIIQQAIDGQLNATRTGR